MLLPSLPSVQKRWHTDDRWRSADTMTQMRRWHKRRNNNNNNNKKLLLLRRRQSLAGKKARLLYGRKRKRMGLLAQMGITMGEGEPMTEQKLAKISAALSMWEAKLMKFAVKFSESPEVLEENSTWNRLLRVRDSLRQLLLKAQMQLQALDQTRM